MKPGTEHSAETRERISRKTRATFARKRAAAAIAPAELRRVEKDGTVSKALRPFADQAAQETAMIAAALGGVENISEQRQCLIQDLGRLSLVLRVLVARFVQGAGDPELASKIGTLVGQRRVQLQALGLERHEKELDLAGYLASKREESRPEHANGTDPAPESTPAENAPENALQGPTSTHSGDAGSEAES